MNKSERPTGLNGSAAKNRESRPGARKPGAPNKGAVQAETQPNDLNVAFVVGSLSSDPVERTLPSGDLVVNYEITSRSSGSGTQTVPVAWFKPPKRRQRLVAGDAVLVIGQVRRRFFRAGGATASRTEIVADKVVRRRQGSIDEVVTAMRSAADKVAEVDRPGAAVR